MMQGKTEAAATNKGITIGVPVGCILGGICGLIVSRKGSRQEWTIKDPRSP